MPPARVLKNGGPNIRLAIPPGLAADGEHPSIRFTARTEQTSIWSIANNHHPTRIPAIPSGLATNNNQPSIRLAANGEHPSIRLTDHPEHPSIRLAANAEHSSIRLTDHNNQSSIRLAANAEHPSIRLTTIHPIQPPVPSRFREFQHFWTPFNNRPRLTMLRPRPSKRSGRRVRRLHPCLRSGGRRWPGTTSTPAIRCPDNGPTGPDDPRARR